MELYLFTRSAFVAHSCQLAVRDKAGLNLHVMQEECVTQVLSVIRRVDALLLDADFLGRAGLESVLSSGARGRAVFLLAGSGRRRPFPRPMRGRRNAWTSFPWAGFLPCWGKRPRDAGPGGPGWRG
ncbi:MAG: hypothetical protein II837_11350 [Treponema sp.]|nr:hypothetical protein [Treponema sp.]